MELSDCSVVVLSAGKGSRVGISKGLFCYRGRPWIEWQLEWLNGLGLRKTIVVLGHEREKYPALNATIVENTEPERGPFSSLAAGLELIDSAVFILPVDVPCPAIATWADLAREMSSTVKASVPRVGGHGGHPVLLSREYAKALGTVDKSTSRLDHELKKLGAAEFVAVDVCDPRAATDLNSPDDWDTFF